MEGATGRKIWERFVAIGDSQTEGLWDGNDSDGVVGFADRLAAMLDALNPGLHYANLAVRGRRIIDVLDEQLPRAPAMRPDLISVCVGMNDITRPGGSFGSALAELDELHGRLAASGATVVTTNLTFAEWVTVFAGDEKLTTALLDRLAHHAAVITTKGKSYRMRKRRGGAS